MCAKGRSESEFSAGQHPRGSQVGSHSPWTCVDGYGRRWNRKPVVPGCVDVGGHPWTPVGDLRIRRLGVRVPPGVLLRPLRRKGFRCSGVAQVACPVPLGANHSRTFGLQQLDEYLHGEARLSQNRTQRPSGQLAMQWDDHRLAFCVAQLHVAAALAHLNESNLGQGAHCGVTRDSRQARAHAGMSTGAMIGVSM